MDEKEKELIASISGSLGFASLRFPFGHTDNSSSVENQSIHIDRSSLETFGGARTFTSVVEWEQSLNNPMTWGVIEVQPELSVTCPSSLSWLTYTIARTTTEALRCDCTIAGLGVGSRDRRYNSEFCTCSRSIASSFPKSVLLSRHVYSQCCFGRHDIFVLSRSRWLD
jgi:hypothetical protein